MGERAISTGSGLLDGLLDGGYETDVVTTIFGPAGSGKTTLCLLALCKAISAGRKVIFVDTEGGFSLARLEQIFPAFEAHLDLVIFLKPTCFEEQKRAFERLREMLSDSIGLIIVDSVSMLYRLEVGRSDDVVSVNRELGYQLSVLTEIARKRNIPTILTSQVYSSFDDRDKVNLVGGDILKYGSKCLLELQSGHGSVRIAAVRKHRSIPDGKSVQFRIMREGLEEMGRTAQVVPPIALHAPEGPSSPDPVPYFKKGDDVVEKSTFRSREF